MRRTLTAAGLVLLAACGAGEGSEPAPAAAEVAVIEATEGPSGLLPPATGPGAWVTDRDATTVRFTGRQGTDEFTGGFGTVDAQVVLDPDDLASASVVGAVDLGSATAGTAQRDDALPTPDWFDVARFPRATFRSTEVRRTGDGRYEAEGTLTIKGVERPLTMPFTLEIDGDRAVADASFAIDRTGFRVGEGQFASDEWVGTEVAVAIHVEAVRPTGE